METTDSKHQKTESIKQSRSPFDLIVNQIWRNKSLTERWPQSSVSRFFKLSDNSTKTDCSTGRDGLEEMSLDSEANENMSTISDVENRAASWQQVVEFMDKLGKKPHHKCLNLNNSGLTVNEIVQLAAVLPNFPSLEELDLSWNESIGGALNLLNSHLQHTPKLRVLELSSCALSALDVSSLGESIQFLVNIEKIDLSWNCDLGGNLSLFTQKLQPSFTLKILKLVDCHLTAEDGIALGVALNHVPAMRKLVLSRNSIAGGFKESATHLLNITELQVFDIHDCSLTEDDTSALTQIIPLLKNLQMLNLAMNKNIGDAVRNLIARIRFLPKFKGLGVNNCNLLKESIVELADTLPNLTELETLDLSWNKCLGGNLGLLVQMLQNETRLRVVKLCSCNLTGQDLASLVALSCAGILSSLETLHLTYNNTVDDQSWVMFFKEIDGLKALSELDIGLMPLSHRECSPWLAVLLSCLPRLPSLLELGMHHWVISASQCELLDTFNHQHQRNIHFTY
ncbi:leucine-rich repeat-containing protein 31 isoform X4 [Hypanus sabinus]|uniref:leucine-rich repeat-containing protein 31 isoform X4 n=1 Tax=Hypanus sabinus TaxID=79690 RepID=UPI0028C37837|nr:leucine-rich repeat-containing protein 31 isoform X4 [Hypanus sabinus]